MKKIKTTISTTFAILLAFCLALYFALPQVFSQKEKVFTASNKFALSKQKFDSSKKTIFIIADNEGTEIFDLIAPFYLFNATEKANVLVVSEKKAPILLVNSLFILPHFSFSEIDSLHIKPDVMVIEDCPSG